jgi:hypothetical protein
VLRPMAGQSTLVPSPILGPRPEFCYCQTVEGLMMWDALSDERTSLSFTIVAGLRQPSHFCIRVLRDSWPYFAVSGSTLLQPNGPCPCYLYPPGTGCPSYTPRYWLPFSSPPTTVEVFEPASTWATDS